MIIGVFTALLGIAFLAQTWFFDHYPFALTNEYQAVFLDNGQVYFGKIAKQDRAYLQLANVYYFQLLEPLQGADASSLAPSDLSLIKLGNEVHGPTDRLMINQDRVLFVENLKDDSKVVEAIRAHQR